jgi:hypothetical protein
MRGNTRFHHSDSSLVPPVAGKSLLHSYFDEFMDTIDYPSFLCHTLMCAQYPRAGLDGHVRAYRRCFRACRAGAANRAGPALPRACPLSGSRATSNPAFPPTPTTRATVSGYGSGWVPYE